MSYPKEYLNFLRKGLLDVIKSILYRISNYGLEGKQNLIIRFHNNLIDNTIFPQQEEQFTTISIQNNNQDLKCNEIGFSLNVNINGHNKRLTVPFDSIALIMDPSARFGIEFGQVYDSHRIPQATVTEDYKITMDTLNAKQEDETNIQDLLSQNTNLLIFDNNLFDKTSKKSKKNTSDIKSPKGNNYQKYSTSCGRK